MQQVSEILQHSLIAFEEAHINDLAMAIRSLGDRLAWANAYSTPGVQICGGRNRLLHQMAGDQTLVYNLQQCITINSTREDSQPLF